MATQVILPKSGMGIEEGTVLRWAKGVGQKVNKGETIAEIETAKATQELEALVTGTLVKILVEVGETVAVNTPIALIEEDPA